MSDDAASLKELEERILRLKAEVLTVLAKNEALEASIRLQNEKLDLVLMKLYQPELLRMMIAQENRSGSRKPAPAGGDDLLETFLTQKRV